jgi:hypothetical protein
MKVIRHQTRGKDWQLDLFLRAGHQRDETRVVRWLMKDFGAAIRSIQNVVALIGEYESRRARHVGNVIPSDSATGAVNRP